MTAAQPQTTLAQLRDEAVRLHRAGKRDEAQRAYASFLASAPQDAGMWSNLGALHRAAGRHDLAKACQLKAYALEPGSMTVRGNLANVLTDIGDYDMAIRLRRENIAAEPTDQHQKEMLGKALRGAGRLKEAITELTRFVAEHPENAELKIQLALSQLMDGRYAEGFVNYGARWQTGELTPREIPGAEWDCESPLDGKSILVVHEQGFGDTITFARFIPELRRYNPAKVMMVTEKPVARLLSQVEGIDWAGTALPEGESFDLYVNMMDLPRLAFARDDVVPPPTRLCVPEDSVARAKSLIAPHGRTFNVGLVWQGSQTYRGNAFRSMSHTDLYPLLDVPGAQFFSLYKGPKAAEFHAEGAGSLIFDLAATERDFADNAATMRALDLVITTCTATAHVAGSLGVPTWVLLHWDGFWLWKRGVDESAWYPSVRLFRQETPRDWAGVMARVRSELAKLAAKRVKEKARG
jgi:tetratricopeptide (TPR) repeat protein